MAISRFAASRVTQGLPKYQSAWDQDGVQQGAIVPIAQVLATGNSSVSITNIPQTFQDLMIVVNGSMVGGAGSLVYEINGGGGGGIYSGTYFHTTSVTGQGRYVSGGLHCIAGWSTSIAANSPMTGVINFMDYTNTSRFKTMVGMGGSTGTTNHIENYVNLWRSTAAITSLTIYNNGGGFLSNGTTINLYGIKAGA